MVAVQGPCDAQCTESGAKIFTSHGVVDCPHDFCPTNTGVSERTTRCRGTAIEESVSEGDGCVAIHLNAFDPMLQDSQFQLCIGDRSSYLQARHNIFHYV